MSPKQAINNKLQGSVAAYLRYGGVVDNQEMFIADSAGEKIIISEYLAKLQPRT